MTERGLEEHELKAFGLFRQAKDPEWPPTVQKGKRAAKTSLGPSEVLLPLRPIHIELNQASRPFDLFLEATKSPPMGSCSSRTAPEPKVSCQVATHRRGLSVCLLESSQSLSLLCRQNLSSSVAFPRWRPPPMTDQSLQRFRAGFYSWTSLVDALGPWRSATLEREIVYRIRGEHMADPSSNRDVFLQEP